MEDDLLFIIFLFKRKLTAITNKVHIHRSFPCPTKSLIYRLCSTFSQRVVQQGLCQKAAIFFSTFLPAGVIVKFSLPNLFDAPFNTYAWKNIRWCRWGTERRIKHAQTRQQFLSQWVTFLPEWVIVKFPLPLVFAKY